jgi:hypothetical protein
MAVNIIYPKFTQIGIFGLKNIPAGNPGWDRKTSFLWNPRRKVQTKTFSTLLTEKQVYVHTS